MNNKTLIAAYGGLLHDIGKIPARARRAPLQYGHLGVGYLNETADALPFEECIRYPDIKVLGSAEIPCDSPAYITAFADMITSDGEDTIELQPLYAVFSTMKKQFRKYAYPMCELSNGEMQIPVESEKVTVSQGDYQKLAERLKSSLRNTEFTGEYISPVLSILEQYLSYVTSGGKVGDISLYDHLKMTSAISACISEYCEENGITDLKKHLYDNKEEFGTKPAFLMYSCDMSGIQSFIYNIPSDGALKALRSRSFSLEILIEHFIDEIVEGCGVTRANVIYSGGGHAYILLPNTQKAVSACEQMDAEIHKWLIDEFGISLYMASAYQRCTAKELMNIPAKDAPYKKIFAALGGKLAQKKLSRYTAEEIHKLNRRDNRRNVRECSVCGTSDRLIESGEGSFICRSCKRFKDLGGLLTDVNLVWVVSDRIEDRAAVTWRLPSHDGEVYMNFMTLDSDGVEHLTEGKIRRVYTKNRTGVYTKNTRNLLMGDYVYKKGLTLEEFFENDSEEENRKDIKRIAVCRADVDNLGSAFHSGFEDTSSKDPETRYQYVNISRTAIFSRQMTMFFRYHINGMLSGKLNGCGYSLDRGAENLPKKVNIVYSGGDDVFLIGVWDDIIESAVLMRNAFERYCAGALTVSAGIGVFDTKYPVALEALETAELEDKAKEYIDPNNNLKNAVCLFSPKDEYTFRWDILENSVIGEKLGVIRRLVEYNMSSDDSEISVKRGKTMLYNLLSLLREADERINIARFAYKLTNLEPKTKDEKYNAVYKEFSRKMYEWIQTPKNRNELITAITLYMYMSRSR